MIMLETHGHIRIQEEIQLYRWLLIVFVFEFWNKKDMRTQLLFNSKVVLIKYFHLEHIHMLILCEFLSKGFYL